MFVAGAAGAALGAAEATGLVVTFADPEGAAGFAAGVRGDGDATLTGTALSTAGTALAAGIGTAAAEGTALGSATGLVAETLLDATGLEAIGLTLAISGFPRDRNASAATPITPRTTSTARPTASA